MQTEHKQALLALCESYVQQRIDTARQAMETAQEAANTEEKSSAGDKYETGRAMAQLERDRHAQLLAEALKMKRDLEQVKVNKTCETVQPGCVVTTDRGAFFIAIAAGKITYEGSTYIAISSASPIGAVLIGRKVGDVVTFNRMSYQVLSVY